MLSFNDLVVQGKLTKIDEGDNSVYIPNEKITCPTGEVLDIETEGDLIVVTVDEICKEDDLEMEWYHNKPSDLIFEVA